jgi:hypothetical protein
MTECRGALRQFSQVNSTVLPGAPQSAPRLLIPNGPTGADDEREVLVEDDTEQQPGHREQAGRRAWVRSAALVGGGLVAGGILAGTLTANAATDNGATSIPSYNQEDGAAAGGPGGGGTHGDGDPSQPHRADEELLTGDTATKVTEAALAQYPDATIERVETDSDGVYEAHLVTADGQHVTVELGKDLSVIGTETHG